MTKSKSRQSSRQATARSGSGGTLRLNASTSKATLKIAVEDAPESTEQDEVTVAADAGERESDKTTLKIFADEDAESEEEAPEVDTTVKATSDKLSSKVAEAASTSTVKETSAAKTVRAASTTSKTAPAKAGAKAVPNTPPLKYVPSTPAGAGGKAQSRDAAKYERRQMERQQRYLAERRRRRNRWLIALSVILLIAVAGGSTWLIVRNYTSGAANAKAAQGTFQEPIFNTNYPPVESVYCDNGEQGVEHIHAYVAIYIDGQPSPLPANVGIPQDQSGNATCFYWLHTHDTTGVIHIEAPVKEVFTFGQFRDEWDQQFVSLGFAPELLLNTGWTIWVNGKIYTGSLASVPLDAHNIITLAYNSPKAKPVTTYNWGTL
ncbi:MAG TPA: hypothetical protein VF458_07240 [Ktedonobacteraceae bacterium]